MRRPELERRTKAFAVRVVKMFGKLPKTTEARELGRQALRSGTSVAANYREGEELLKIMVASQRTLRRRK